METIDPSSPCITLNVGGQMFMTTAATLKTLPNTRLGRLALALTDTETSTASTFTTTTDNNNSNRQDLKLFFDRNPDIINSLLDLYRTGHLHLPKNVCGGTVIRELEYWGIPTQLIKECCFKRLEDHNNDVHIVEEIDKFLSTSYDSLAEIQRLSRWNRIWVIMERPQLCRASKVWSAIFFCAIFLSVLFYAFETTAAFRQIRSQLQNTVFTYNGFNVTLEMILPSLPARDRFTVTTVIPWLRRAQQAVFIFFLLEFFLRLITCPSKSYFFRQVKTWLDIFLLLQNGLSIGLDVTHFLVKNAHTLTPGEGNALIFFYSLSVARVLRIFYLVKDFETMKVLLLSTKSSMQVLILLSVCVSSLACVFGASVFLAEVLSHESTIPSIPYAMWYAIVTMTTVGYGDAVPVSAAGRLLGALCALCGVIVMALPIAIIASRFTVYHDNISARQQLRSRETFLKDNPGFCRNNSLKNEQQDRQLTPHKPGGKSSLNIKEERDLTLGKPNENEKSCFDRCWFRPKLRRVSSHSIKVCEYSSQVDLKEFDASDDVSTTPRNEKEHTGTGTDKAGNTTFVQKY